MRPRTGHTGSQRRQMVPRLVRLLLLAQSGRRMPPIPDLAQRFGCCPRTIRRDLMALEAAGVRVIWRYEAAA